MNLSQRLPDLAEVPESLVNEAIWDTFLTWTNQRGRKAREEQSFAMLPFVV